MRLHDPTSRSFASDNCAGVHPDVLSAIAAANHGHQPSYGADVYTDRSRAVVRQHFGPNARAFPVFNGTGANIVALQAMADRWEAVVCAEAAHLNTDECAAPEHHGFKLLTVPSADGRLDPADLVPLVQDAGNRHHAQPGVVSISQSTELGTCYTPEAIAAISAEAHRHGLRVHLDGARLANAAAGLGASLRELTTDAGVDVVSFGITKNGGMFGDCILVLNPDAVRGMPYLKKATTQLPSKTRFISAQLIALLTDDLWWRNASAANAMARRLRDGIASAPGVRVIHPVHANAVFAKLPDPVAAAVRQHYDFSTWDEAAGVVRLMTAFDTEREDVDDFVATLVREAEGNLPERKPSGVRTAHSDFDTAHLA